ncbi:MAG: hypothetical protein K6A65_01605, partial [Succinivibrionaceae bacterium]|nr:hypothetical protein [Succinivibrionaceae bacterium]
PPSARKPPRPAAPPEGGLGGRLAQERGRRSYVVGSISSLLEQIRKSSPFSGDDCRALNSLIAQSPYACFRHGQGRSSTQHDIAAFLRESREQVDRYHRQDWGHGPYFSRQRWDELIDKWAPEIQSLGARLRQELVGFDLARSNLAVRSGTTLHPLKLPRVAQGLYERAPFAGRTVRETMSTGVVMLIDLSGSMYEGAKIFGLAKALALLQGALGRCVTPRLKIAIYAYSDHFMRIKSADEPFTREVLYRLPAIYLNNNDYPAMIRAAGELLGMGLSRKVIVAVTDGFWDYPYRFGIKPPVPNDYYAFLGALGIETYGLMIGEAEFENTPSFTDAFFARDPAQVPRVLTDLFVRALRRSRRLHQA